MAGGAAVREPDLFRMRRERRRRLHREMERRSLQALLLFGTSGVRYAVGNTPPVGDPSHLSLDGSSTLVVAGDELPHVFTSYPDLCPQELRDDHCHPAPNTTTREGVQRLMGTLSDLLGANGSGPVGIDQASSTFYLALPALLGEVEVVDAAETLSSAKVIKTPDEIACISIAQRINETAMYAAEEALEPGIRQSELTGIFLRRIFELGATGNSVDPIWQPMPASKTAGPFTTNGDVAFPLVSSDRLLVEGDVIWVDTGIDYQGYASDFGTTWIVGEEPAPSGRQRRQFDRWREIVEAVLLVTRPGATGSDLTAAAIKANGGVAPWLDHLYLAHGIGTFSAEMPIVGSDLGPAFDDSIVLAPNMVLVLEPVVWDDGASGYRYEVVVVVTEDGYRLLSGYPFTPFSTEHYR